MKKIIHNSWQEILADEFQKPYYQELRQFLKNEYQTQQIHPDMYHIFEALEKTAYEEVKVVILGQDPYHGANQAHGLSFSVQPGIKVPPSLKNIYKELEADLGISPASHESQAYSHRGKGWEKLTDEIIQKLNQREKPIVFILWGKPAQQKISMIDTNKHLIISSVHPSPLSAHRGFFGSKPFSQTNQALLQMGETPINWQLPERV